MIPPIGMFFFWGKYIFTDWNTGFLEIVSIHLLSFIPFTLLFLGKYIVYGKFYIFKNEEGEENKLRDSSRKDDSKNSSPHSLTVFETSHTRPIDFKSLKVDWNKIIG